MKAEEVTGARLFIEKDSLNDRPDRPAAEPSGKVELKDQVTLSPEALLKAEGDSSKNVERVSRPRAASKPMPDPRYTAQAILDRELLGLKKFYS